MNLDFNDIYEKPDIKDLDFLKHYGVGHLGGGHSGRYEWGSGEHSYQRAGTFLTRIKELEDINFTYVDEKGKFGPKGKEYTGETAIAHYMGLTTQQYRTQKTLAKDEERTKDYNRAKALYDSGYGYSEIARKMGLPNESSARSLLKETSNERMRKSQEVADILKKAVDEKGMIDIGDGAENELSTMMGTKVSKEKLREAVYILEREGYKTAGSRLAQVTDPSGAHQTTLNVLGPSTMTPKDAYDYENIHSLIDYESIDNSELARKNMEYPASMNSNRLMIRYKEDGGIDKDGVIELRRGVEDLSLDGKTYAQARILVDDKYYLKGMALYSDDENFPDGVDVIFNTNKSKDKSTYEVLKSIKKDSDNPFGSNLKEKDGEIVGQSHYIDKNGNIKLGLVNRTRDEGDWSEWQDKVPSQFLSKQSTTLANRQLNLAIEEKTKEYNDILKCENPTLRKSLLNSFASDCDSASVHLYAAALPGQKHQVILPINSLKDTETYAPNYENGTEVALIRYPHAGTFEIPILRVNNKNKEGNTVLTKNARDVIGINSKVAARLSGADFDGDTVMVIPINGKTKINSTAPLKALEDFDPKSDYGYSKKVTDKNGTVHYYNKFGKEYKIMNEDYKQKQMGVVSNLITDMTIAGASSEEMARAVKHSMVVIDAVKHELDYNSSKTENKINALQQKYQKKDNGKYGGAATLLSRAKNELDITKTQGSPKVNIKGTPYYDESRPEGSLIFKETDNKYLVKVQIKDPVTGKNRWVKAYDDKSTGKNENKVDKRYDNSTIDIVKNKLKTGKYSYTDFDSNGNKVKKTITNEKIKIEENTQKSTRMAETDDANSLISVYSSSMEKLYANYANSMKSLANEARKVSYYTKDTRYSPSAKETYKNEVNSLLTKLDISEKNAPRERQAQRLATIRVKAKQGDNPSMSKEEVKKTRQQELLRARNQVGAKRQSIKITDKEWDAIQSGAISANKLSKIFEHMDADELKERATPRDSKTVTDSMIIKMQSMKDAGRTNAEIAKSLGISASSVSKYLNE